MMEVEFERSLSHNYMILNEPEGFCEDYQMHILTGQIIPHILPVELRFMNGRSRLYYDISARQKLSEWLRIKKVTLPVLNAIIKSLKNVFDTGMDYMLECDCFMLDAEYIFIDIESYELSFCFYPVFNKTVTQAGQDFLQYLLEMLDYNDKHAVEKAYELFRLCMRDGFSIELLGQFVEEDILYETENKEENGKDDCWVQIVPTTVMDDEVEEEEEQFGFVPINSEVRRKLILLLAGIEFIMTAIVIMLLRTKTVAWIIWLIISALLAGVILILARYYERLMQFSQIISVKSRIKYDDSMNDYMESSEDTGQLRGDNYYDEAELEKKEIPVSEYIPEETVLFGGRIKDAGIRRLKYIGEGNVEDIFITKNPFTIGKSVKDVDYKLDYPFISRMHLRIDERAGEYYITDTNSKNGIMLNREYLNANDTVKLSQGDRIELGNLVFLFQ